MTTPDRKKQILREVLIFFCGLISGAALLVIAAGAYLRGTGGVIQEYEADMTFEAAEKIFPDTAAALPGGWSVGRENCMISQLPDGSKLAVYKLCQSAYAAQMMADPGQRRIAAVLPCSFALYEVPGGKVRLARLNRAWLGWLLGGSPRELFNGVIADEQHKLLESCGFMQVDD